MAKYIECEAFLEQERKRYCKDCSRRQGMKNGKYKTLYKIGEAPCRACEIYNVMNDVEDFHAADVRPVVKAIWKHVQWVVDEEWQEGGYWISRCSNCSMPYHTETPFCPHCGADMRAQ